VAIHTTNHGVVEKNICKRKKERKKKTKKTKKNKKNKKNKKKQKTPFLVAGVKTRNKIWVEITSQSNFFSNYVNIRSDCGIFDILIYLFIILIKLNFILVIQQPILKLQFLYFI
jgi:intein/homing endonuclease